MSPDVVYNNQADYLINGDVFIEFVNVLTASTTNHNVSAEGYNSNTYDSGLNNVKSTYSQHSTTQTRFGSAVDYRSGGVPVTIGSALDRRMPSVKYQAGMAQGGKENTYNWRGTGRGYPEYGYGGESWNDI
jgi:hypothetical protein